MPIAPSVSRGMPKSSSRQDSRSGGASYWRSALLALAVLAESCRPRQAEAPQWTEPKEPVLIVAPNCAAEGPSATLLRASTSRCGKGDTCVWVDERIQNPTDRTFLLPIDGETLFTADVTSLRILRSSEAGAVPVLELFGRGLNRLVQLPTHADVTLRNVYLGFRSHTVRRDYQVTFFDSVVVNHRRHLESLPIALPRTGNLDLAWLHSYGVAWDALPVHDREPVDVHARCMQTIPVVFDSAEEDPP